MESATKLQEFSNKGVTIVRAFDSETVKQIAGPRVRSRDLQNPKDETLRRSTETGTKKFKEKEETELMPTK